MTPPIVEPEPSLPGVRAEPTAAHPCGMRDLVLAVFRRRVAAHRLAAARHGLTGSSGPAVLSRVNAAAGDALRLGMVRRRAVVIAGAASHR